MVSQLCALAQHGAFAVSAVRPRARRADLCLPRRHVHHEHARVCCPDSQLASEGLVGLRPTMPMRLEMRQDASHLCVASWFMWHNCQTTQRMRGEGTSRSLHLPRGESRCLSHVFRRLWLPLPLPSCACWCGRLLDHRAACSSSRVFGGPWVRTADFRSSLVFVKETSESRPMLVELDCRSSEVPHGLTFFKGAQLATDDTLVSRGREGRRRCTGGNGSPLQLATRRGKHVP